MKIRLIAENGFVREDAVEEWLYIRNERKEEIIKAEDQCIENWSKENIINLLSLAEIDGHITYINSNVCVIEQYDDNTPAGTWVFMLVLCE